MSELFKYIKTIFIKEIDSNKFSCLTDKEIKDIKFIINQNIDKLLEARKIKVIKIN